MKTLKALFVALILAFTLGLSACDVMDNFFGKPDEDTPIVDDGNKDPDDSNKDPDDGDNDPDDGKDEEPVVPPVPAQKYAVTFELNGGTATDNLTEYTAGEEVNLPVATREHYVFDGWFSSQDFAGQAVTKISTEDTGDKRFYAKWTAEKYSIAFYIDGNTYESDLTEYSYNEEIVLPVPALDGYDFSGWYVNEGLDGDKTIKIFEGEYGNKTFYGAWIQTKFSVTLVTNGGTLSSELTEYVTGTAVRLPAVSRDGYDFLGWYENENFTGQPIDEIVAERTGNLTFYANWQLIPATDLQIAAFSGYDEGACVELDLTDGLTAADYQVSYKLKGASSYTQIDSELIRVDNGRVRVDIVGIAAGSYVIKVTAGNKTAEVEVSVTAQDRSGYAHFNATDGVGGYNNDGTPKSGAVIIYVSEQTKNTVTATLGSTKCVGLVKILQNLSKSSKPVIIRVIGKISAATWNNIEYAMPSSGELTPQDVIAQTKILTGKTLELKSYTQEELISGGFNTYNTSVCSVLDNLTGTLKYDSSKKEFDSCWNDCSISGANNVTVEGIGTDAEIFQWGMTWKKSNSIEVKNLTFTDYTEDACSFEGTTSKTDVDEFDSQRIWLHNNTFNIGMNYWDVCSEQDKHDGDGSTDFKGCSYITISYNHYVGTHKTGLIGGSNSHMTANITFHHNFYDECQSRLPLARQANMHMYNNYYYGTTSTCISLRANAYAFIEACYFENSKVPVNIQGNSSALSTYAVAKLYGCEILNCTANTITDSTLHANDKTDEIKALMIVTANSRNEQVASNNTFAENFDTNSSKFYYDSVNKVTKASRLTDALQAKQDCINLAGVLKPIK